MNPRALAEATLLSFKAAEKKGGTCYLEPGLVKRLAQMLSESLDKIEELSSPNPPKKVGHSHVRKVYMDGGHTLLPCPVHDCTWGKELSK